MDLPFREPWRRQRGRGPPGYGALRLDRACSVAWCSSGILDATYRATASVYVFSMMYFALNTSAGRPVGDQSGTAVSYFAVLSL